ncbi:mRNA polyadenylation-related protein, related [Eimeria maxima]|uniref:mRNA polyadenylation-related protein, related n=1 Tax=Eimeria maxima TaxID=5804 RepID=U6M8Q3_EIMMA|nr:mRNA polyadenylation-related protein, related [Eimeria maxima]CDJ58020.1 mRNA polyadenylation-related protein, related [Eimeria maxima]
MAATTDVLRWRLRGSSTSTTPVGLALPVSCGELRVHLKEQMGVAALTAIDLLLSLEGAADDVLPDSMLLHQPLCVLVQRKPAAAAAAALSEAELKYQRQMQEQQQRQEQQQQQQQQQQPPNSQLQRITTASRAAAAAAVAADGVGPAVAVSSAAAAGSSDSSTGLVSDDYTQGAAAAATEEERLLLQAVMDVHDSRKGFLRADSTSSSSSRRGPGSHNLMWVRNQDEGSNGNSSSSTNYYRGYPGGNAAAAAAARQQQHVSYYQQQQQQHYAAASTAVSADYICHMCGEMGHHIKNCPKSSDAKQQKKIRPATGLPSSFLRDILPSEIHKYQEVYIKKDGSFAVLKTAAIGGLSLLGSSLDSRIQRHVGGAAHLKCGCCNSIFKAPTLTPCCGETFCRACIVLYLQQHPAAPSAAAAAGSSSATAGGLAGHCPGCNAAIAAADLAANTVLQQSVDTVTCSNTTRWTWQQQQQQQDAAAAGPAAAASVVKNENPQPGSIADLLSRRSVSSETGEDSKAAAATSAAAMAATAETAAAESAAANGEPTSLFKVKEEQTDASLTPAASAAAKAAATRTQPASLLQAKKEEPDPVPRTPAAAATATAETATTTASQSEEEALPDISDLLHFNIPVEQIMEQHRIAEIQIKAYREKRKAAVALETAS